MFLCVKNRVLANIFSQHYFSPDNVPVKSIMIIVLLESERSSSAHVYLETEFPFLKTDEVLSQIIS